jgi:hypothetical protein
MHICKIYREIGIKGYKNYKPVRKEFKALLTGELE